MSVIMHVKNILKLIKCKIGLFCCYYYAYYRFRVFYCYEWILKLLLSQWNLSVLFQVKFCMRKLNFVRILAEHDENGRSSMLCSVVQHRPPPGIFTTLHTCMHTHTQNTHSHCLWPTCTKTARFSLFVNTQNIQLL